MNKLTWTERVIIYIMLITFWNDGLHSMNDRLFWISRHMDNNIWWLCVTAVVVVLHLWIAIWVSLMVMSIPTAVVKRHVTFKHPTHSYGFRPRRWAGTEGRWDRQRMKRDCRRAGGHWWHCIDPMGTEWQCCRCPANRDGNPKDGT